jgi:hypothetical protein
LFADGVLVENGTPFSSRILEQQSEKTKHPHFSLSQCLNRTNTAAGEAKFAIWAQS